MNRRHEQREAAIQRAVQEVLGRGLSDPRVRGLLTITGVRLTEDGRQAIVSVSVLPADRAELTMHGLRAASGHIRRDAMKRISIREMPTLEFRLDESVKKQAEVLAAINRAVDATAGRVEPTGEGANDAIDSGGQAEPGGVRPPTGRGRGL